MSKHFTFILTVLLLSSKLIKSDQKPSVLIVGAGASGIAAASRLLEKNFTNLLILEAEGRIGGRIYSVQFHDAVVDLGAQWCHGRRNNVIYKLVKNYRLLEIERTAPFDVYHSNIGLLDFGFVRELQEIFMTIYSEEDGEESSLGERLSNRYYKIVGGKYGSDSNKISLAESIFYIFAKTIQMRKGAFSLYEMAPKNDFRELEGHPSNWKEKGHKMILDVLMKKYPNSHEELPVRYKTRLNKKVTSISWNENNQVKLECSDGSTYSADHVIFTPSLGVLKNLHGTFFEPPLPREKNRVIEDLGIDGVVKVFLHFPVKWWPTENFTGFSFAWSQVDSEDLLNQFPEGPIINGKHWLLELMGLHTVNRNPNVLLAWFTSEIVPHIELLPDSMIIKGIVFVTNKILGNSFDNITPPDSIVRYNWYSNENFRGAYSFQTVRSSGRNSTSPEMILAQPLRTNHGKEVVLFAGEATHPMYYSSVHGAIESGYREANRIIKIYRN